MPTESTTPASAKPTYGPRFVVWVIVTLILFLATFINILLAAQDVARVRAIGLLLATFGGCFVVGIVENIVADRPFNWSLETPRSYSFGTFTRRDNPVGFWLVAVGMVLVFFVMAVSGLMIRWNADRIAAFLSRQS